MKLHIYIYIYIYTTLCQPQGVDTGGNQYFRVRHSLCLATAGFRNGVRCNVNHMNRYNECDISTVECRRVCNAMIPIPPCSVDHTKIVNCTLYCPVEQPLVYYVLKLHVSIDIDHHQSFFTNP